MDRLFHSSRVMGLRLFPLVAGTYTVSEPTVPPTDSSVSNRRAPERMTAPGSISCQGTSNATVTLGNGEAKTCLVLNVAANCTPAS